MRKSAYVLGRKPVQERLKKNGVVTVAAVECLAGTPERWIMFVETKATGRQRRPVLYRVHVRLK